MNRKNIPPHLLSYFRPRKVYKPKDDLMIPHRVYDALMTDGWYGRADCVWHKKSPMPESVTDRPTKAHEYLFLLTKSAKYFYDADAIREPHTREWWKDGSTSHYHNGNAQQQKAWAAAGKGSAPQAFNGNAVNPSGANKRSVWTLGPEPYAEAHFATFPTKLVEPCILAGTSARGCCPECGAPWERVTEREAHLYNDREAIAQRRRNEGATSGGPAKVTLGVTQYVTRSTVDWQPTCTCFGHFELIEPEPEYDEDGDETVASQLRPPRRVFVADGEVPDPVPCTVLDPFMGSGTTASVAIANGRNYIGFELNPAYAQLAERRIAQTQPPLLLVETL